jgi:segregation and condensation protein A
VADALAGQHIHQFLSLLGTPMVVVNFIAMLELSREALIEITQAEPYAPIYVRLAYSPN